MITPITALEICRFLHDGALLLLWGATAFVAVLLPRSLRGDIVRQLGIFPIAAAVVAMLTTLAALPLEAAAIGDGWSDGFDAATLHAVLFDSTVGYAWQLQAVAAVLLLAAWLVGREARPAAIALGAALGLGALALTGHASMHQGWLLLAHRGNDIVHLLSGGAWLGALIPFSLTLAMLTARHDRDVRLALRRFSTTGHAAVALVLATGLVNTALVLGRWPTDWASPYQLLLSGKIVVVGAMAGLAILNRYVFVPALGGHPGGAIRAIRIASLGEIILGVAAIALVAVFGMLDPL